MADIFTPEKRSEVMAAIRSSGTKPERRLIAMVQELVGEDLEVDCNVRTLPGTPDVVVPELDLAIFADGCFFHGCPKHGKVPSSNVDYWAPKLARNVQRDTRSRAALRRRGYAVWRFWEHDLTGRRGERTLQVVEPLDAASVHLHHHVAGTNAEPLRNRSRLHVHDHHAGIAGAEAELVGEGGRQQGDAHAVERVRPRQVHLLHRAVDPRRLGEDEIGLHLLAVAENLQSGRLADTLGREMVGEHARIGDIVVVDAHHHVLGNETGLGGRAVGIDVGDEGALDLLEAERLGHLARHRLELGAEPGLLDLLAGDGAFHERLHQVGRNGEADAVRAARARDDRRIDADHPPAHIDQRAARVAGIDGGVGLNKVLGIVVADAGACQRRDDAAGDGLADAEGIADGEHQVADLHPVGVVELQVGELAARPRDAQNGEVQLVVAQDDLGIELALVGERHPDLGLAAALDDVVVGDDDAVLADEDARAQRVLHPLSLRAEIAAEELLEEGVVEQRGGVLDPLRHVDVDHGGGHLLHEGCEGELHLHLALRHLGGCSSSSGVACEGEAAAAGGGQLRPDKAKREARHLDSLPRCKSPAEVIGADCGGL